MDRSQEFDFVWGLLDEAATFLDAAARVQLCIQIGAGQYRESIMDLLQHFTHGDHPLPPGLSRSLRAYTNGFVSSDSETSLRQVASRIVGI